MLFIHSHDNKHTYFTSPILDRVEMGELKSDKIPNSYDYDIIVGNDISHKIGRIIKYPSPSQTIIDVTMLGLNTSALDKYKMEAVVYAYNHYYISDDPFLRVDIPVMSEKFRELPENYREIKFNLLFYGNSRFKIMRDELNKARNTPGYVGASWPTSHYLANNYSELRIYYGPLQRRFETMERKPINLILNN